MNNLKIIQELKPIDLNCSIFSVYDYDGLSMQELLCQFFTKINEIIKSQNEVYELCEWLVNIGLKQEVAKKLEEWLNDGTLSSLINEKLFADLNDKINKIINSFEHRVNIMDFGANTDLTDNIPSINKAIEFLINNYGGGTVFIPKGVFYVSPKPKNENSIKLYSNLKFEGIGDESVIKISNNNGNWGELFTHESYPVNENKELINNLTFEKFKLDCNIKNSYNDTQFWVYHRTFINSGEGYNLQIKNMKVISDGVWFIHGDNNNSIIEENTIEWHGENYTGNWFDVSSIWLGGENNRILNNTFTVPIKGRFTPETCIEFQGHNVIVDKNICKGYTVGILPSASTSFDNPLIKLPVGAKDLKITNNIIDVSNKGIFLWCMDDNNEKGIIERLIVENNTITINKDTKGHNAPNAGFDVRIETSTFKNRCDIVHCSIKNNTIQFKSRLVNETRDLYLEDAGIKFFTNVECRDIDISNNKIINCGGNGIVLHTDPKTNPNNFMKDFIINNNKFYEVHLPIVTNRNVTNITIVNNTFSQSKLYPKFNDNMISTIETNNKLQENNRNFVIKNNVINTNELVKPYYPIFDLSLISDKNSYYRSKGNKLDRDFIDLIDLYPAFIPKVHTINKYQFFKDYQNKYYRTKFNYPSTKGNMETPNGEKVVITEYINPYSFKVNDATNIKPNSSIKLPTTHFQNTVFFVQSIVGNQLYTECYSKAILKEGINKTDVIGQEIAYYFDVEEVR